MNVIDRLKWAFTGQVAELIVEDYDDSIDAIVMPTVSVGMAVLFLFAARTLFTVGTLAATVAAAVFGICSLLAVYLTVLSFAASMQYANEWTHPSGLTEEVRN